MRIGLIARCDNTGLGIQSMEFFKHIPCKALVIDFSSMAEGSHKPILHPHPERFPMQKVFKWGTEHNLRGDIPMDVINDFLKDVDIVFAMETPYDYNIFNECKRRGIKTILQLNYEFLDFPNRHLPAPDLFAAPSMWNYDRIPDPKIYLPVPANTMAFQFIRKEKTFVHISGRPAINVRNGTDTFFESLNYVKNDINVIVRAQTRIHIPPLKHNINLSIDISNKENYTDNYTGGVLVMPRKYGGLCLVMNEAIAAGMPVIATDISPNNQWLPKEWLVESQSAGRFQSKMSVEVHTAIPQKLAEKIDQFCDNDYYDDQVMQACRLSDTISWETFVPVYYKTFRDLLS